MRLVGWGGGGGGERERERERERAAIEQNTFRYENIHALTHLRAIGLKKRFSKRKRKKMFYMEYRTIIIPTCVIM